MTQENKKDTILVVDDIPENIDVLDGILKNLYNVKVAINGSMALKIAESKDPPDLILLDIMMPEMDGFEVCRKLKENSKTKNIPVIFVTAKGEVQDESHGFYLGAVDYITKPVSPSIVEARVKTHLQLYDQNKALEQKVRERTAEVEETRLQIIRRLGRASEYKDNETGMHVIRMSHYSQFIAQAYGLSEDESELILNAAPMHDVGKIGIPDNILLKPGKLDDKEWDIMRRHSLYGYEIIGDHNSELLKAASIVAYDHHEKWNGKGYPRGLKEKDIHLYGRIVAIADVFDALTSERPYKEHWSVEKAVNLIKEETGQHFDPELVQAFLDTINESLKIKEEFSDD